MVSKAFGEQNPTQGETAVSWQTWSDGVGGIPILQSILTGANSACKRLVLKDDLLCTILAVPLPANSL